MKKGSVFVYLNGNKRYFVFAVLFIFFSILLNYLSPQVIRITIDNIVGDVPVTNGIISDIIEGFGGRESIRNNLLICGVFMVAFSLLSTLFNFFSRMTIVSGTEKFVKTLRENLYSHVQKLPFKWHNDHLTGDIIQRCSADVEVLKVFVSKQLIEVFRIVLLIVLAVVMMFNMNVTLTLISIAFIPLVGGYSTIFYGRIGKEFLYADETEGELLIDAQENLTGVRVVRAFGREAYELNEFKEKNNKFVDTWIKLGKTMSLYWGIGDIVTGFAMITVVVAGSVFAANNQISLGEFVLFIGYTASLTWPIRSLGRILSEMSKAGVSIKRIEDILKEEEERDLETEGTPPMDGDIVFEDVSFGYDSEEVLKNLSFTIKKGTTVGILGATGSGKSTITYLLNRLYDISDGKGRITIGGVDIKNIKKSYLRENIGLILQEPFLFSRTIAENISIGKDDLSERDMYENAQIASIHNSINSFAKGYKTLVGERGVTLSGGQKQRIAITRTLVCNTPVIVFDDSLSAIDLKTDKKIRENLKKTMEDATVVIISHRINTLKDADEIIVLVDGSVESVGNHAALIKKEGIYKRIYEMQFKVAEQFNAKEESSGE